MVPRYHGCSMRNPCGAALTGEYCAACGQAEHDGHPPTIAHFAHDLTHEFIHVDGKIFNTLKALFFQPGRLTQEYWAGHIVSWVRPICIFLIIAGLHLLLSSGVGPLNFRVQLERSPDGKTLSVNINNGTRLRPQPAGYTPVEERKAASFWKNSATRIRPSATPPC